MNLKMTKYIGTKNILATPMGRKEYNDYRGWELPSNEDGTDRGMLVEYLDGGKSNHPDHKGYISWSPLEVFDKSYQVSEYFSDRILIEARNLAAKLNGLNSYMATENFVNLDRENKDLLYSQSRLMNEYLQVLGKRLELSKVKFKF